MTPPQPQQHVHPHTHSTYAPATHAAPDSYQQPLVESQVATSSHSVQAQAAPSQPVTSQSLASQAVASQSVPPHAAAQQPAAIIQSLQATPSQPQVLPQQLPQPQAAVISQPPVFEHQSQQIIQPPVSHRSQQPRQVPTERYNSTAPPTATQQPSEPHAVPKGPLQVAVISPQQLQPLVSQVTLAQPVVNTQSELVTPSASASTVASGGEMPLPVPIPVPAPLEQQLTAAEKHLQGKASPAKEDGIHQTTDYGKEAAKDDLETNVPHSVTVQITPALARHREPEHAVSSRLEPSELTDGSADHGRDHEGSLMGEPT